MYSTFEQYKTDGGALPEDQYNVLAKQAAYMIDAATMGRARDAPSSMAAPLSDCECALVAAMAARLAACRALTMMATARPAPPPPRARPPCAACWPVT